MCDEKVFVYRGLHVDLHTRTIYHELDGKPYYYSYIPKTPEDAMQFIDLHLKLINSKYNSVYDTYTISNLCKEIILPKSH